MPTISTSPARRSSRHAASWLSSGSRIECCRRSFGKFEVELNLVFSLHAELGRLLDTVVAELHGSIADSTESGHSSGFTDLQHDGKATWRTANAQSPCDFAAPFMPRRNSRTGDALCLKCQIGNLTV